MGFQYGTSEKSSPAGRIAVLRMGNLQAGEILYDNLAFTSNATEIARYQLIAGDLLFNRTNSAEHVGKTSIYRGNQEAIFAGYLIRFHPILTSSEFMNYVMNSSYHHSFCQTVKSDAVNQSNINAQKLSCFLFPLPPIDEQERIANQVESLLKYIDGIDENAVSLENTISFAKQKILDLAIRGKLVPQDPNDEPASELLKKIKAEKETLIKSGKLKRDKHESFIFRGDDNCYHENINGKTVDLTEEIPFVLPQGWEWYRLNSIYNFIDYRGKTPTKKEKGIPLVTAKNVKKGYISYIPADYISLEEFQERKSRGVSSKGDILFTTEAPLGNAALADLEMFSAGQRIITFQQYTSNNMFPNKLQLFFILSPYFQDLLDSQHTGSTVAGIKAERLKKMLLPLPPLAEQKRIVSQIENLFSILETMHE